MKLYGKDMIVDGLLIGCVYEVEFTSGLHSVQENKKYVFLGNPNKKLNDVYLLAQNGGYLPLHKSWIKSMHLLKL